MSILNRSKNKSVLFSFPKSKKSHGIEVKKVPISGYVKAMEGIESLPGEILKDLFPGKQPAEIIASLTRIDMDEIGRILMRAIVIIPKHITHLLSPLLGVTVDELEALTPAELMDVAKEFIAVNDLSRFFTSVSGMVKKHLLPTQTTGSKDGLQSPPNSESANPSS